MALVASRDLSRTLEVTGILRDNGIPIVVFSIREKGNLARVLAGEGVQTIVQKEG